MLLPKNFEENKGQLKIYVAKTTSKALKEFLDSYRRLGIGGEEFRQIELEARECFSEKRMLGLYVEELLTLFLDLEKIRNKYPKDDDFQKSAFYLTAIHEVLHSTGELGKYKGYLLEWLNDGIVELLTREIAGKNYSKIVRDRWDPAYSHYTTAVNYLNDMVGKETVLAAFFKKDIQPIINGLKALGVSDAEIDKMFASGSRLREDGSNFAPFSELLRGISARTAERKKEMRILRETGEIVSSSVDSMSAYMAQFFQLFGKELPEKAKMQKELLEAARNEYLQNGTASARLASLRHAVAHFGGFKGHEGFQWLENATAEHLARRIMREYYYEEFMSLDWKTLETGQLHSAIARQLADIVGERALERAFVAGDQRIILEQLSVAGFPKEDVEKLLELGWLVGKGKKEDIDNLASCLRHMRRKRRRLLRGYALEELEHGLENDGWESAFGKAGAAAAERLQKEDAVGRNLRNLEAVLRRTNLLPEQGFNQPRSMDELRNALINRYSGGSAFLADQFISAAKTHLTLQDGMAGHSDISSLADELTALFSDMYFAKPTMEQLLAILGEEIYYAHSHPVPLAELFDYREVRTETASARFNDAYFAITGSPEEKANAIASLYNIADLKTPNDINAVFEAAEFVSSLCNRPMCEMKEDISAAILLSKAKLGDMNGSYTSTQLIDSMGAAIKQRGQVQFEQSARISETDARQYLKFHFARRDVPLEPLLNELKTTLGMIYPSSLIIFDVRRGFARYNAGASSSLPNHPGLGGSGSMGKFNPYASAFNLNSIKPRFGTVLAMHGLDEKMNPFQSGPLIRAAQDELRKKGYQSDFTRFMDVFQEYRKDGPKGIRFDMDSERPNGFLTPEEVLEMKYALCMEHACLFLELVSAFPGIAVPFKVFKDEDGNPIPHFTAGVFISDDYDTQKLLDEVAAAYYRPSLPYYRFGQDKVYRKKMLERVGIEGDFRGHLVLFDLSIMNLGAQYQHIEPITTPEEMLSAYLVDRGSYHYKKGRTEDAIAAYESALAINPRDQLARSHLIAYNSDINYNPERILDLTKDLELMVNTEDFVSRSTVLIALGEAEKAIEPLLWAIQISEDSAKARFLLSKLVGKRASL